MKFETKLNEKQARSMLEGLAKASSESGGSFLHTSSNATAKVPATIFDDRLGGKTAAAVVTLIWTKTTGSIQVATKESIKDYMFEAIKALENVYVKALDNVMEPGPRGAAAAVAALRVPAWHSFDPAAAARAVSAASLPPGAEGTNSGHRPRTPEDPEFKEAILGIATYAAAALAEYPVWHERLHGILVREFGYEEDGGSMDVKVVDKPVSRDASETC